MPAPSNGETFDKFLEGLRGRVPQEMLDKVDGTFRELKEKAPDAVSYVGQSVMYRHDAERVYNEAKQIRTAAEQQQKALADAERRVQEYEAWLQQNAASMSASQVVQANSEIEATKNEANLYRQRLETLENNLKAANVYDVFADGLPELPDPATGQAQNTINNNGEFQMPANNNQNQGGQPNQLTNPQTPAPSTPPASPLEYVTKTQMQELLQNSTIQGFQAGMMGSLRVQQIASELSRLTGQTIDPIELSQRWVESGKDIDTYANETYELNKLRAADTQKRENERIEAEVQKRLAEARSREVVGGTLSNPSAARSPVFTAFAQRMPANQAAQPANPSNPSSPANDGSQHQNLSNPPGNPQDTTTRVAEALASGKYRDAKFDLSSDLFRRE